MADQAGTSKVESCQSRDTEEALKVEASAEDLASEVHRVNRILEIENMDWERQLQQAVSVLLLRPSYSDVSFPIIYISLIQNNNCFV